MKSTVYYSGFEGEPEIQFILKRSGEEYILSVWEGYFDKIMELIPCDASGWTGISAAYHLCSGWDDHDMWIDENITDSLKKFESVSAESLGKSVAAVLDEIKKLYSEAIAFNYGIIIHRE